MIALCMCTWRKVRNFASHKFRLTPAHWIGRWRHQNNSKSYPNHGVIFQKPQGQNLKKIVLNYKTSRIFRGFEQLSSSICCRVMAGQNLAWDGKW